MGLREKIDEKIRKKEQEIAEYHSKLTEGIAYIQGLQDVLKMLPRDEVTSSAENIIRPGSDIHKTLELLKKEGKPMHITEILTGIGKSGEKKNRVSLSGSLGFYIRKNEIFSRPAPNTFGLKTWENNSTKEPPESFGLFDEESIGEK